MNLGTTSANGSRASSGVSRLAMMQVGSVKRHNGLKSFLKEHDVRDFYKKYFN